MTKLNTIRFCLEDSYGEPEDVTYIDDKYVEEYCVDYDEIAKSLKAPGIFEIFTCGCGVAGCAGIYEGVRVEHENDLIRWTFNQPYEAVYLFSKKEMFDALYEFAEHVDDNNIEIGSTLYAISGAGRTLSLLEEVTL